MSIPPTLDAEERRRAWRRLRHADLAALADTMSTPEIAAAYGVLYGTARSRLAHHGLTARPAAPRPLDLRPGDAPRCTVPLAGSPARCGVPLDPDGTCRWAHQHTDTTQEQPA